MDKALLLVMMNHMHISKFFEPLPHRETILHSVDNVRDKFCLERYMLTVNIFVQNAVQNLFDSIRENNVP